MADDRRSQDEYEYPSDEYYKGGEHIIPPHEEEPTGGAENRYRRIISIIGVIIAIIIVYLVLMYLNSKRKELAQPTAAVESGTAAIPVAALPVTTTPPIQAEAPMGPPPSEQAAIQRSVELSQASQQSIADLQNQIQQLQTQIGQVTSSVSTLTNQMQVIANEIRAVSVGRTLKGRGISLNVSGKAYTLRALIPGRAWLQAKDGSATTVAIGDRLPGYGIIQMINTDQGIVTTSSGAIIQYGPRDN
jgi:intracellular multiplication protein IcmG